MAMFFDHINPNECWLPKRCHLDVRQVKASNSHFTARHPCTTALRHKKLRPLRLSAAPLRERKTRQGGLKILYYFTSVCVQKNCKQEYDQGHIM